ncbi:hypothetical protein [Streptomyces sp. CBMA156]|uniref:hypothetical protein n=1 Tax=Streptomyces sp. CBMA156 TaxID=1930280 RepID=UPI00166208A7|nr:hypothetical protein [Streptomyces sp. CBMA156]MBD0673796.1 hypothetical protein [Streptomyces sp. CBMA156]MBD0674331.1 hypothetical protein [Streptomyces sp. CBMA156]
MGAAALLVAGCGGSGSSPGPVVSSGPPSASAASPTAPAPTAPAPSVTPSSGTPDPGSGTPAGSGLTLDAANGGSYRFASVACVGEATPTGALSLTATPRSLNDALAELVLKDGEARLLLTLKGFRPVLWKGSVPIGGQASRTAHGATLTAMPVTEELGDTGTVTGTLTCSGTDGLY